MKAIDIAEEMMWRGIHKSIVNRILEPYSHINVVASGTDDGWMNFFGLRLDKAAQPEMRVLAELMWRAYSESEPRLLRPGEWHLPFVDNETIQEIMQGWVDKQEWPANADVETAKNRIINALMTSNTRDIAIKVSVARCARVSYESFETGRRSTVSEDLALYERLVGAQPLHASPAEHQATPDTCKIDVTGMEVSILISPSGYKLPWAHPEQHGNFSPGWRQYRKMLPNEAVAPLPPEYR